MIPNTIHELANALMQELGLNFDLAVKLAWKISTALEQNGVELVDKS